MTGRNGRHLVLKVPCGTLIKDIETQEVLHDFTLDGEKWEICQGGKGGRGNYTFRTPTNRAPNICTPGKPGEEKRVELELKLIADVGLVGFPNAGKSTLVNALTDVKVKMAPYPFTTLQPNIGFFQREDYTRIFIADIPGIIEFAHQDRGLGLEFLRHIERNRLLLFVLDSSGIDGRTPTGDYRVLLKEIEAYNPELLKLPSLVVLNKIDAEESQENIKEFHKAFPLPKKQVLEISALSGQGTSELLERISEIL
jgi:GTP-binding protein